MAHDAIRIAHLTDILVAESSETILNALKFLAVAMPIMGGAVASVIALIERQPREHRIPAAAIARVSV